MKIYYFNDTKNPQSIFVNDLNKDPIILKPASGQVFQFAGDESFCIPWVKVWENQTVLIANMPKEMLS